MSGIGHRLVGVGSAEFAGAVALRDRVLRDPLGRPSARGEARGQGAGASLYRYAEEWAVKSGVGAIEAEARSDAVGFYVACGFTIEGEEYMGHGIPHRKVRKILRRS